MIHLEAERVMGWAGMKAVRDELPHPLGVVSSRAVMHSVVFCGAAKTQSAGFWHAIRLTHPSPSRILSESPVPCLLFLGSGRRQAEKPPIHESRQRGLLRIEVPRVWRRQPWASPVMSGFPD